MGNCIRIQCANPLDGDVSSDGYDLDDDLRLEAQRLISSWRTGQEEISDGGDCGIGMMSGGRIGAATKVKIRITKKQLEELVRVVDMQGMSLEQMLKKGAGLGAVASELRHRHWRPALQSIPELE